MSGLFVSQTLFLFQVWPDLEGNQNSANRPGELLRPLTQLMLPFTSPRETLPACPQSPPWNLLAFLQALYWSRQHQQVCHFSSLPI